VRARPVGVRLSLPVLITVEVVALTAFIALPPYRAGWWPAAVITAVTLMLLLITVHRRNVAGWVAALTRWRSQRRRGAHVAAAVDVTHGDIVCGVRTDEYEAITMVRVTGRPYEPTLLRGSAVSLSTNLLPLDLLAGLLDQPGTLRLASIDVVSAGARVRSTTGYPPLYSTLLADRPAAGRRTTHLIVRLDLSDSVPGLAYRNSIGAAAAAATERIVNALMQEGIRAATLSAAELDEELLELGAGLVSAPSAPEQPDDEPAPTLVGTAVRTGSGTTRRSDPQLGWRVVAAKPGHLTTYYYSPEDITTASLNQVWALRSDDIVQAISIWRKRRDRADGSGPVMVSAMLRTNDPQRPEQPPTLYLNTLPGEQFAATLWAAPTAKPRLRLPARVLDRPEDLQLPLGPTGILVGAALRDDHRAQPPQQRDDLVMWSLTDPEQTTRIVMDTSDFYVRQLLVRAVAVGERVAIYSDHPERWLSLVQHNIAVVEGHRAPDFVPSIVINDRPTAPPSTGLSATVITLGRTDTSGPAPDLRFVQASESAVRVSSRNRTLDLAIVAFRQEQAWTG
jgi:type VII secretion protein EccE